MSTQPETTSTVSIGAGETRVSKAKDQLKMKAESVKVFYGDTQAINGIDLDIYENEVLAFIGPSGCGKSTFLRCLNRMNDTIDICRVEGKITLDHNDIYAPDRDVVLLRAQVGIVFQKPNPFPKSIYENIAYGPRLHGLAKRKAELDDIVESSLRRAGLWQIFLWQGNELRNFFEARTSAAIIVLLGLMLSLNALAIWLRKKLETRW